MVGLKLASCKHPAIILLVAALIIRVALAPLFTTDYDNTYWAYVISNIDSGNGLYGLVGYCYTPVWGYILASLGEIIDSCTRIVPLAGNYVDLLPISSLFFSQHQATVTTVEFNLVMKAPLILADLAAGYLIYVIMMDRFANQRKALVAMALWLFCPVTVYMSSVGVQFDTISALLLLLTIYYVRRSKWMLTGVFFGLAVMLKMFPVFGGLVILAYIYVRTAGYTNRWAPLVQALGSFIIVIGLLMVPVILSGNLSNSITFMTGRSGSLPWEISLTVVPLILIMLLVTFKVMITATAEEADDLLFLCLTLAIACPLLLVMTPQYLIVLLPLWCMDIFRNKLLYEWGLIIAVAASFTNSIMTQAASVMASAVKDLGIFSYDTIMNVMGWLNNEVMCRTIGEWSIFFCERIERGGLLLLIVAGVVLLFQRRQERKAALAQQAGDANEV